MFECDVGTDFDTNLNHINNPKFGLDFDSISPVASSQKRATGVYSLCLSKRTLILCFSLFLACNAGIPFEGQLLEHF